MSTTPSDKQSNCKYCRLSILSMSKNNIEYHCVVDGWEDDKVKTVTKEQCEHCTRYKSKYIEYPVTINGIENKEIDTTGLGHTVGCLCEIRPCDEQYQNKSYLGIYLGELPISIISSLDNNGILTNSALTNPAVFVPALKKIIYGCESWWREIKDINDFKNISDEDIENQWYVQLLRQL